MYATRLCRRPYLSTLSKPVWMRSLLHARTYASEVDLVREKIKQERTERMASLNEMEQMKEMEKQRLYHALNPLLDPWAMDFDSMDYMLPYKINWTKPKTIPGNIMDRLENFVKNAFAMYIIADYDGFPGRDTRARGWIDRYLVFPWRSTKASSLKEDTWIAPMRGLFLQSYKDLNKAVADRNTRLVKDLSKMTYREDVMARMQATNPKFKYIWNFHKELSPLRVLSIRATEGNLGEADPPFGSRLTIQALCRIHTEQSLEIYDAAGKAVHEPQDGAVQRKGQRVPAKRRSVTEYLTFEKKMWYDSPFYVREQLWPDVDRKVKA